MMTQKLSTIKCPKCGYQPNILSDICLQCGAGLQKICGECGHVNGVEKNYCDKCGAILALHPPAPPPPPPMQEIGAAAPGAALPRMQLASLQDSVSEKADSFRRKAAPPPPKPPPPGAPPPPAAGITRRLLKSGLDSITRATSALMPDSRRLPRQSGPPAAGKRPLIRRLAGPAVTAMLTAVLLGILYLIAAPSLPKLRLLMTAKSYLSYISEGRFEKAYELLSTNSKASITREDYVRNSSEYYTKAPAWQFKDVQVFAMAGDAAMIRYQLKEGDGDWKQDYISFVREHNRWTRPYIWVLFQPIDDALKRQDYPQALFLAQRLYLTDPVDPRTSGYLCAAEYYMGLYDKAAESCRRTAVNAAVYPVGYSNAQLYEFSSHYADSLRFLQKDRAALAEYDKLLRWPELSAIQKCQLRMNRADSYVFLKDYDRALQEAMAAADDCEQDPEKAEAQRRLNYLGGSAGASAVALAQRSRFQQGAPPVIEMRRRQLEDMKARLGPRGKRFLPRDEWTAAHLAGPEYRVFLRQQALNRQTRRTETQDVYVFLINLWTGRAKVEKAPQEK